MSSKSVIMRYFVLGGSGMAQTKLFGKDLSAYDEINIEELLLTLTEEEIEELGTDLIDPDVS